MNGTESPAASTRTTDSAIRCFPPGASTSESPGANRIVVLVAVFVLISLGLHFTFGLLNVVNLMHGEFLLLGAYTAFEIQSRTGNVVLGMLVAPIVGALIGVAVERGVLRVLYERPLDSLLATFGLSVIIRQVVQLVYRIRRILNMRAGEFVNQDVDTARFQKIRQLEQRRNDLRTIVFADQGYGFKGIFHAGI